MGIYGHFLPKIEKGEIIIMVNTKNAGDFCDNAIVHFYPNSPYIGKCCLHLRSGNRIVLRLVLRDQYTAYEYLNNVIRLYRHRTIVHW